ncbi:MAG: MFS transporter [Acidimicrobiales bacterium]
MPGLGRHRDFRLLWSGQSVSEVGSQVTTLAFPLVAVEVLGASAFEVGVLTACSTAAFLLVGLPVGVWVDRLRRRRVMMAADIGRMAAVGSIPAAYALGGLTLVQLYVTALVAGILTVFFDVAYQSYLPGLVGPERLVEGNAKLAGSAQVAQVAGPSMAGGLVQAIGGPMAVAVDAASFLVSSLTLAAIATAEPAPAPPAHDGLRAQIGEGLRFVLGHRTLRAIAGCTGTSNLFSSMMAAVEVVFLVRVIHVRAGIIGLLFAAGGIGGVVGALTASSVARRIGGVRATLAGMAVTSGGLVIPLTGRGAGVVLFAVGSFFLGFGAVVYNINQVSFRQRLCPPALLGRMNATMRFLVWGEMPIGALIGGALASGIGLRNTLWVGVLGQFLAITWLLASPLRSQRDFP